MRRCLLLLGWIALGGCREVPKAPDEPNPSFETTPAHDAEQGAMFSSKSGSQGRLRAPAAEQARSLEVGRKRRAFPGAPPWIPHAVSEENERTGTRGCLSCHGDGAYAPSMGKYAPRTPHPDWTSCRQCHVPGDGGDGFRPSGWSAPSPPPLDQRSQPTGPPAIPHSLQYRGDCLSCHAGPSAPVEIRTSHPERTNCRQCHVPSLSEGSFPGEAP